MILAQAGQPAVDWAWVAGHTGEIWQRFVEHTQLTVMAVALGLAISLPLGVYAHRHRRAYGPITAVAGILYTIPSLALFMLLVPLTGLGLDTALIALTSYTLLILVRNVVAGLAGVPADAREAALGMGFLRLQMLLRVELPLALPVIITGVRIATVTTVGLVTVAALIGQGGFGYFILLGFDRYFNTALILGAVLSTALAVVMDALLAALERAVTPWSRARSRGR